MGRAGRWVSCCFLVFFPPTSFASSRPPHTPTCSEVGGSVAITEAGLQCPGPSPDSVCVCVCVCVGGFTWLTNKAFFGWVSSERDKKTI